jgi:hypothetical protein
VSQLASCSSSLTLLQLLQCEIDKYDACELLQGLSHLQHLQLSPLVTLPSNCHSSWGLEDLQPQGFRTVGDSLLGLRSLDLKDADVSPGLLVQLAEITQLRRLRIDMSACSSLDHLGNGSSREQAEGVGSHVSSNSSSVGMLPSTAAAVDQGLTGADLQVLTQLSCLSHLVFKLRPCCQLNHHHHQQQQQQQAADANVCQQPSSNAPAAPAAAAAAAAAVDKGGQAAVAALCQLRSLSVLELGNLGLGLLQLLQLSQLSGLQHCSYSGCCQQPSSSSWSVQLSASQLQQVSGLEGVCFRQRDKHNMFL